jgi:hypothetical protein
MESLSHVCTYDGSDTIIAPGKTCPKCESFRPLIRCDCKTLYQTKHPLLPSSEDALLKTDQII